MQSRHALRHAIRAAAFGALFVALPLHAQDAGGDSSRWTIITTTKDGTKWELDRRSVATVNYLGREVKSVWLRATFPSPRTSGKIKGVSYTLQVSYYDCAERKSVFIRIIAYRAANDSILADFDRTDLLPSLQAVVPGSIDESILLTVCATTP